MREFISSTSLSDVALKEKWNRTLLNAISNWAAPHVHRKDRNKGFARYTSSKDLLVKLMEL